MNIGRVMWKAKAKVHRKGGMPRFVSTDEERGLVQLLSGVGYSQDRIARYISNDRGASISTKTPQRVFRKEIEIGQDFDRQDGLCLPGSEDRGWRSESNLDVA